MAAAFKDVTNAKAESSDIDQPGAGPSHRHISARKAKERRFNRRILVPLVCAQARLNAPREKSNRSRHPSRSTTSQRDHHASGSTSRRSEDVLPYRRQILCWMGKGEVMGPARLPVRPFAQTGSLPATTVSVPP